MENIGWDVVEGRVIPERLPANNDHYYMKVPEILASDEENYIEILKGKIVSHLNYLTHYLGHFNRYS